MSQASSSIIGLRQFRENLGDYIALLEKGKEFTVVKRSKPVFRVVPVVEEKWEEVVDFTKIKKGGVHIDDILKRL